MIRFVLD